MHANHELIQFLSQPLAMELSAAQSMVSLACGTQQAKQDAARPVPFVFDADGEMRSLGIADYAETMAMDSVAKGAQLIAVVPLAGALSMHGGWFSTSTKAYSTALQRIDASPQIGTIISTIDSPGGTVTGTMEAANVAREIRERGDTKMIAVVEPMMASAATWIGTAFGEVVVTPSGEAGSIGVISMYQDWSKAMESMGIKLDIARTPAKKARFSGMEPMTDEMREEMERRNVEAYGQFVGAMVLNRSQRVKNLTAAQVEARFGGGEMMGAEEARESGLVDRIATFDEVLAGIGRRGPAKGSRRAELTPEQIEALTADTSVPAEFTGELSGDTVTTETPEQETARKTSEATERREKLDELMADV